MRETVTVIILARRQYFLAIVEYAFVNFFAYFLACYGIFNIVIGKAFRHVDLHVFRGPGFILGRT